MHPMERPPGPQQPRAFLGPPSLLFLLLDLASVPAIPSAVETKPSAREKARRQKPLPAAGDPHGGACPGSAYFFTPAVD